jgi:hypothetical protein
MTEDAAELGNYLPLPFKTPKEQEYIEFLWDAFETNYTHGKYQPSESSIVNCERRKSPTIGLPD